MKRILLGAAVLAIALASCQNEELVSQGADGNVSVKAVMGADSRTMVDENGTVTWTEGDKMLVYGGNSQGTLTLTGKAGETEGTFSGYVQGSLSELTTTLYPASMADNKGNITLTSVTYPNSNAPMVATWNNGGTLQFSHLCGMVRLQIVGVPSSASTLTISGTGIAGKAQLNNGKLGDGNADVMTVNIPAGEREGALTIDVPVFVPQEEVDLTVALNNMTYQVNGAATPIKTTLRVGALNKSDMPKMEVKNNTLVESTGWSEEINEEATLTENEEGYYEIGTAAELATFAQMVNNGNNFAGKTVKLTANIDLNDKNWTPIGSNNEHPFKGTFDGQSNKISNLEVEGEGAIGLFGALNGNAQVKDLTIENVTLTQINAKSGAQAGVITGYAHSDVTISGVTVRYAVLTGYRQLGGIAGNSYADITNCGVYDVTLTAVPNYENGVYDNGDKVGGIVGLAQSDATYKISGNKVEKLVIEGYRDLGGIVGAGNAEGVTNNKVDVATITADQTIAPYEDAEEKDLNVSAVIGCKFSGNESGNETTDVNIVVKTNDKMTPKDVSNITAVGADFTLPSDVDGVAEGNSGYGKAGIVVNNGTVLDGNNKEVEVSGANTTWDCGINPVWGTVKNLTIGGCFRGIFMSGAEGDVIIDNVIIDNVCYTFNSDAGNKDYEVKISNSTLNGWTSYSDVHKLVTFTKCNFGRGTGGYKYAFCRPYNKSVFTDCVFETGYEFDATRSDEITFVNCKMDNGTLITKDNVVALLGEDAVNIKF